MSHFVPPTLQKLSEQTRLQTVWQRAAQKLQAAEYIAIVGYSWPANDHLHQLFALGGVSETVLRGVIVSDKDEKTIEHIKTILRENVRPVRYFWRQASLVGRRYTAWSHLAPA